MSYPANGVSKATLQYFQGPKGRGVSNAGSQCCRIVDIFALEIEQGELPCKRGEQGYPAMLPRPEGARGEQCMLAMLTHC